MCILNYLNIITDFHVNNQPYCFIYFLHKFNCYLLIYNHLYKVIFFVSIIRRKLFNLNNTEILKGKTILVWQ